jgi:hypothetical protein
LPPASIRRSSSRLPVTEERAQPELARSVRKAQLVGTSTEQLKHLAPFAVGRSLRARQSDKQFSKQLSFQRVELVTYEFGPVCWEPE